MPHLHEKIDFTVSVYIVHKNKVLLHIHKKLKKWLPVGGHIELHEDPNEAALREAKEEAGLDVKFISNIDEMGLKDYGRHKQLIVPNYYERHEVVGVEPYHEHIDHIYFTTSESDNCIAEEGETLRWFSEEDLEQKDFSIPSMIVFYAKQALKAASRIQ